MGRATHSSGVVVSTVRAAFRGVARPVTGWHSAAGRVAGGRRGGLLPPGGGGHIRPRADDRGPDLAYRDPVPTDEPPMGFRRPHGDVMWDRLAPPTRTPLGSGPRGFRSPFVRWPRAADAVLAVAAFLVTTFVVDAPGDALGTRAIGDVPVPALLVFAVASAALYWRRRAPLVVLGVALISWAVTLGSGYADLGGVTIIALYSAGRYASDDRWGPVGVAAAIVVVNVDGLTDPAPWGEAVFGGVVMFVAWYVGRRLRLRAERSAQLLRDQAAEARRIVTEERARIARELHDVVAHRVSLMTVQAGAAKAVAAEDPEGAREAMGAVEEAGRQALDELRHLLGVLRPETDPDGLGPQPSLADLPRLVEQVRTAGLDVSVTMDGLRAPLPARVELSLYRIVQEALTNVLKHAGPRARAEVHLRGDRNAITVEVLDDGHGVAAPPVPGASHEGRAGHGLVGMRERAQLLGGRIDAGPRAGGGFRVVARLPVGGETA
jgi:signal transduction histidine kinase